MHLVKNPTEIRKNILTVEQFARSSDRSTSKYYQDLIRRGHNFVWTKQSGQRVFAPSRFVGYQGNDRDKHEKNRRQHGGNRHGKVTDECITRILGERVKDPKLETDFQTYCASHEISPHNRARRFWQKPV
jgi:hypothetical protein